MWRRLVLTSALVVCAASAPAQRFAIFQTRSAEVPVTTYTITSYATCNGIVDDTGSIQSWNATAQAQQALTPGLIEVIIPAGAKCCALSTTTMTPADRLKKVRFVGGDKTTSGFFNTCGSSTGPGGIILGPSKGSLPNAFGGGVCQAGLNNGGCSARLNTAHVGDMTITLTSASCGAGYISRFPVGQYIVIGGLDIQKSTFPPNNQRFDYAVVTGVSSCTLTLDRPLTYDYLSTWPVFDAGSAFSADAGGPATAWNLTQYFDTEIEYRNLTLLRIGDPMDTLGKKMTFRDVSFGASDRCLTPSQHILIEFYNVDGPNCAFENDKFVERTTMSNSTFNYLSFQSGGANKYFVADHLTVATLNGTSYIATLTNSTITSELKIGTFAYGRSKSFSCTDCTISGNITAGGPYTVDIETGFTLTSGVLTRTDGDNYYTNTFTPGNNVFWIDGVDNTEYSFQLLEPYTTDGGGIHINTSLTGQTGFPPYPKSSTLGLKVLPVETVTCVRCVGSDTAVALSRPACQGRPLFSCWQQTYTGSAPGGGDSIGTAGNPTFLAMMWGNLESLTFDVPAMMNFTGTGGQLDWSLNRQLVRTGGATCNYIPTINLGAVGTRVVTPSGVTGNQSGDGSLTVAAFCTDSNGWMRGNPQLYASRDISAQSPTVWPHVTLTLLTNQGVVPAP